MCVCVCVCVCVCMRLVYLCDEGEHACVHVHSNR
jgi:hypothetical protein